MKARNRLRDYSKKESIWDKHKNDATNIAELLAGDDEFKRCVERLTQSAQEIGFKWQYEDGETSLVLNNAWFSRWRHDPLSNWRKSLKWQSLWFAALPNIFEAYPTHRWLFLTLTIENCRIQDLKATCQHLNKAFRRLTLGAKLAKWFDPRKASAKDKDGNRIAGYYKALEITKEKGRDGYAHPHLHVLLHLPETYFKNGYVSQKEWQELWKNAAQLDYLPVVDIRTVKPRKRLESPKNAAESSGLIDAVLEVCKYPNKAADLLVDAEWTKEYIRQMHRIRLTDVAGTLRNFINDERLDDINVDGDGEDAENTAEDADGILFFAFNAKKSVRKYVRTTEKTPPKKAKK